MTSKLMLLAGAAALVFTAASAEPPHDRCPPGERCPDARHSEPMDMAGPMKHPGPMNGPGAKADGPGFRGGPDGNRDFSDRAWQDDRGGWHRDHDRYWRPDFRGGFAARERLFFSLRQHQYNRFDGEPFWQRGHFVVKTFDRRGRPVLVELNPYSGDIIGVIRF